MDRDLQTLLTHDNPWIAAPDRLQPWLDASVPDGYLEREVVRASGSSWGRAGRAHLVIGPRQAGKTTALRAWAAERGEPLLAVDCEQVLVQRWCRSAPLFLEELDQLVPQRPALLLDEAQHLDEAGLFVKGLVDRRYPRPVLVTGSSAWHLGSRTRESLAGRATRNRLLPFSFAEVTADLVGLAPAVRRLELERRFARHAVVGGYPDVWLTDEDPRPLLLELVHAFVVRDASDLFRIERPDAFHRLLQLAAGQTGSLVNRAEWGSLLGLSSGTVASYLSILEEAHVLATLRPFAGGRRSELTSRPKVFFVDCGLRNQLVGDLRPFAERSDRGPLLENWVLSELLKSMPRDRTLHFWRSTSGSEVDFVLAGSGRPLAVEVKASPLTRPRIPRAARSFVEAYEPERLVIVNTALHHEDDLGATRVVWTRPDGLRAAVWGSA